MFKIITSCAAILALAGCVSAPKSSGSNSVSADPETCSKSVCTASTTLSGSDNHFGRFLSRCDAAYFVVSWAVISCVLVTGDVVAGAFA